jgi:putative thioredoxin
MNQWTVEVNEENFENAVLDRSQQVPVLVDFWAPWCGPCKVLGPVLEKLADEYAGEFILAKINVDENPGIAGAFSIQGIPAVKLFRDGDLASEFTGALPEAAVRQFLSQFLPNAQDKQAQEAEDLAQEGKTAEAKTLYEALLAADPNYGRALLGLGQLAMAAGDTAGALEQLDKISLVANERKEADRLIAKLKLQSGGAQDEAALRAKVKAEPSNLQLRYDLAQTLAGLEKYDDALGEFLAIVKADRQFQDDGARKAMIQIFEVIGSDDPLTDKYRTELAAVLFR